MDGYISGEHLPVNSRELAQCRRHSRARLTCSTRVVGLQLPRAPLGRLEAVKWSSKTVLNQSLCPSVRIPSRSTTQSEPIVDERFSLQGMRTMRKGSEYRTCVATYAMDAGVTFTMPWIRALPDLVARGSLSTELGEVNMNRYAWVMSTGELRTNSKITYG